MQPNTNDPYTVLSERIRSGAYAEGERLAPERQLAEEFQVARTTVRRAIQRLSDEGLIEARKGYRPVVRAAAPARSPLKAVALLIGSEDIYKPFSLVMRGCEAELRKNGYLLVYMDTWAETTQDVSVREEREIEALENLRGHGIGGLVIWCQSPEHTLPTLKRMRDEGTAIVTIDRELPDTSFDHVGVDNLRSALAVGEHLIRLGHRHLLFANGDDLSAHTVREREEGFLQALRHHSLPADESCILRFPMQASEQTMADRLAPAFRCSSPPTAIFAVNDVWAFRVAAALRRLNVRVPEDVSLSGFDDMKPSAADLRLTTVRQPFEEIGRVAAQTVLQRMGNPHTIGRRVLLETRIIERDSAHPPRRSDQEPQEPVEAVPKRI